MSRSRQHPVPDKEQLSALYWEDGLSMAKIGSRFGVSSGVVQGWMHLLAIPLRSRSAACGLSWEDPEDRASRARSMRGVSRSAETRARIAAAKTGTKDSADVAARKRAVLRSVCDWNRGLTHLTDPRVARMRAAAVAVMRTRAWRERRSVEVAEKIRSGNYWKRGYHESPKAGRVYYMSGWEARRCAELDLDPQVHTYVTQPMTIPYLWDGMTKHYVPDLLVTYMDGSVVLEEIKPQRIIDADRGRNGRITAKLRAGEAHARSKGWGWRVTGHMA